MSDTLSPVPRLSRQVRRRAISPALLLVGLWCAGCVFFDNSYDPCFGKSDCDTSDTSSSATTEMTAGGVVGLTGDGDSQGSGGRSLSSGGDKGGDGDTEGGAGASGGRASGGNGSGGDGSGSGGEASGGTGSGGEASGGTGSGGASTGGMGATSSGGESAGAGGGTAPSSRLVVNELLDSETGFVEIYNTSADPIDLAELYITNGVGSPNWSTPCALGAAGTLPGYGYLEITPWSSCRGPTGCVTGCEWVLSGGETVYVLDNSSGSLTSVSSKSLPDGMNFGLGQSYAAYPDGSNSFEVRPSTPGAPNASP